MAEEADDKTFLCYALDSMKQILSDFMVSVILEIFHIITKQKPEALAVI